MLFINTFPSKQSKWQIQSQPCYTWFILSVLFGRRQPASFLWTQPCVCVTEKMRGRRRVAHVSSVCLFGERKRQTGEERDGERARHVAAPSGRLLFPSSCCLRAGGSTAAPCQLLLPQKPPCMQNRHRLPSLLGHAFPPLFVSLYNRHLLIFTPPPPFPLYSNLFQAIECGALGNSSNTHKHGAHRKWHDITGKSISRAEADKEKQTLCCFYCRPDWLSRYGMRRSARAQWKRMFWFGRPLTSYFTERPLMCGEIKRLKTCF